MIAAANLATACGLGWFVGSVAALDQLRRWVRRNVHEDDAS